MVRKLFGGREQSGERVNIVVLWYRSHNHRLRIAYTIILGLVKRQISNPEKEQPNPMPAVPETVEVRAAEELSEAPAVSNEINVTPPVVKQEEGKDAESVKEKGQGTTSAHVLYITLAPLFALVAQRSPNTFFSYTDTKIAKEKPNLEVKVVENNEKGTLIKTEDQKPDKNGVKPETATTASTANTAKLPATASATKRLLPPIHTSLIKKTSAIDKATITKDIAAIINGSSSVAATTNATATATASAIPTPATTIAAAAAVTAAATTVATTATANNDTNSSNTTNNVSTNQSSAAERTAAIESSADKPEAEEPAEKEEKPVEEGPAKKRKRRSRDSIPLLCYHELIKIIYFFFLQEQVADSIGPRKAGADSARKRTFAFGRGGENEGDREGEGSAAIFG